MFAQFFCHQNDHNFSQSCIVSAKNSCTVLCWPCYLLGSSDQTVLRTIRKKKANQQHFSIGFLFSTKSIPFFFSKQNDICTGFSKNLNQTVVNKYEKKNGNNPSPLEKRTLFPQWSNKFVSKKSLTFMREQSSQSGISINYREKCVIFLWQNYNSSKKENAIES